MWRVSIRWGKNRESWQHRSFGSTEDLKVYLDREGFCLQHGCPLPVELNIERVEEK